MIRLQILQRRRALAAFVIQRKSTENRKGRWHRTGGGRAGGTRAHPHPTSTVHPGFPASRLGRTARAPGKREAPSQRSLPCPFSLFLAAHVTCWVPESNARSVRDALPRKGMGEPDPAAETEAAWPEPVDYSSTGHEAGGCLSPTGRGLRTGPGGTRGRHLSVDRPGPERSQRR